MGMIKRTGGFTIIETMMFLAITGVLAVGILVGTGSSIAQQRYRDSVMSLQSFVQDQYSKVVNVTNSRDNSWRCETNAVAQEAGEPRGTGDCVMLGRLITVAEDGQSLSAVDVLGEKAVGTETQLSDIDELATYSMVASPIDSESKKVAWGATIVKADGTMAQPSNILIVRSPLSGRVLTFANQTTDSDPKALVASGLIAKPLTLCVSPSDGTIMANRLGVRIGAFAASQSAVQVPPESDKLCA